MEEADDAGVTSTAPTIRPSVNGPYIVSGVRNLRNSKGEPLEVEPVMALCRCGGSANKPFCDGTHRKIGFSGEKREGRVPDRVDDYRGARITIHDNRGFCAHAGYCTDNLASVFKLHEEPWIDASGAAIEQIAETIRKCPSGALSYTLDGVPYRPDPSPDPSEPGITVTKDGPYAVTGGPELVDDAGSKPRLPERYTLCRCGGSKNKPFCDGTHWRIRFTDEKN